MGQRGSTGSPSGAHCGVCISEPHSALLLLCSVSLGLLMCGEELTLWLSEAAARDVGGNVWLTHQQSQPVPATTAPETSRNPPASANLQILCWWGRRGHRRSASGKPPLTCLRRCRHPHRARSWEDRRPPLWPWGCFTLPGAGTLHGVPRKTRPSSPPSFGGSAASLPDALVLNSSEGSLGSPTPMLFPATTRNSYSSQGLRPTTEALCV